MTELQKVLMKRDNMTLAEVNELIKDARQDLENYTDPEEFMADWFGLEPDYFMDVV